MSDKSFSPPDFLTAHNCQFFLGPRPGKKSVETISALDLTHCCTLLSEREDGQLIRKFCPKLGCDWIWLPIEGGRLEILAEVDIVKLVQKLAQEIGNTPEPRIYFHCSAGIHRTGFVAYVLLRMQGRDRASAYSALSELRAVTADQVGDDRLDVADQLLEPLGFT